MITSLCLLAGYSTRMGKPKQHVRLGKTTFLEQIIDSLEKNRDFFDNLVFVGQKNDLVSKDLVEKHNGVWLVNETPEKGPLSSIRIALESIEQQSALMLWPVDHPLINPQTVRQLCEVFAKNEQKIVVPSINDRRGHPSIFPANLRQYFFSVPEHEGARKILQLFPAKIEHVLTTDVWVRKNINTPELLAEAEAFLSEIAI